MGARGILNSKACVEWSVDIGAESASVGRTRGLVIMVNLTNFVVHYVDPKEPGPEYSPGEVLIDNMPPAVNEFLLQTLADKQLFAATAEGRAHTGIYDGNPSSSDVRRRIEDITFGGSAGFFEASRWLANRLHSVSPKNATAGVLAILRLIEEEQGVPLAILLKIRHDRETFVRLAHEARTELDVQQVDGILQKEILKGACLPHPSRSNYDATVIDRQMAGKDVAGYFATGFLSLRPNESDATVIEHLLDELGEIARKLDTRLAKERVPEFIAALRRKNEPITSQIIVNTANETGLFSHGVELQQVSDRLVKKFGSIDLLPTNFRGRGKFQQIERELIYEIVGPRGSIITVNGSAEVMQEIVTRSGDAIHFAIETTNEGCRVKYK